MQDMLHYFSLIEGEGEGVNEDLLAKPFKISFFVVKASKSS
jgi:hypothetical protein